MTARWLVSGTTAHTVKNTWPAGDVVFASIVVDHTQAD